MQPFLTTQKLCKSFGQTRAVHEVSISVEPGKVYTVLGENGSGKSTLVKMLAGIVPADSGGISVNGNLQPATSPAAFCALGINVVLQEVLIAANRTALENVLIGRDGLWAFKQKPQQRRDEVKAWVDRLSTRQIALDQLAGDLPLNEQQVLVVARGFAARPKVLILDEVTAALDLADREKVFDAIRAFCAEGGAVIFVSHRMPEIMELSDVVLIMHNGENTAQLTGADINPKTLLAHLTQEVGHE